MVQIFLPEFFYLVIVVLLLLKLCHIEFFVNNHWERFDLCTQLLFNLVQVKPVVTSEKIYCETKMSKATWATNAMQIGLGIFGKVEVDHNVDWLNVNSTRK